MDKLISMQDAIEAICDEIMSRFDVGVTEGYELVEDALSGLPSVEPERKRGKWIVTNEFDDCCYAKCNQCNVTQIFYYGKPLTNYCPNCGSRNIEEGEQSEVN